MASAWHEGSAEKILKLANEIADTAARVIEVGLAASAAPETGFAEQGFVATTATDPQNDYLVIKAENFYKIRRRRDKVFGGNDLFFDPCWDILLDLYIAYRKNRQISITSACMAANVPTSTALRWISTLERRGLIISEKDANDSRRRLVSLTVTAIAQVSSVLENA